MKRLFVLILLLCLFVMSTSVWAIDPPTFDQLKTMIRSDHPRLFLNKELLPRFKEYAQTVCAERLVRLKKDIAGYPTEIQLEYKKDLVDIVDGRMVFKRAVGDQNAVIYGIRHGGGIQALECAIVFLATGETAYRDRAFEYLRLNIEYIKLAKRSQILPEWYHTERLSAIIAWDWLYNEMSDQQRRDFIVPMLEYIDFMRNPGYQRNSGDDKTGNYGEPGLWWFAGLAAFKDGFCDEPAEKLLQKGYELNVKMMNFREDVSGGCGLLSSITSDYSFGAYPWASYNFLHTLRSAASFDGTEIWTQMAYYSDYFFWMAIPCDTASEKFLEFGWGDSSHESNSMNVWLMYTHLAQALHFYGKKSPKQADRIRAVMNMLPERLRRIQETKSYPYIPFILFDFDPNVKSCMTPEQMRGGQLAQYFPSYGLMNVRSGSGQNDTYASFKAGAKNDGHQHYDENTFIIYKSGFQALDTGTRGQAQNHLIYYPQTVAHNGILIRAKNEPLANYWYPANAPKIEKKPFADGGQYLKKAAKSLGFEQTEWYAVSAGDAKECYAKDKSAEAVRFFVFVKPDYFVVYDRVKSIGTDREKVFLLHTQNEPQLNKNIWRSDAGQGSLFIRTLLPKSSESKLVGGAGHEFETGGVNYPLPPGLDKKLNRSPNWLGRWRLEVTPKKEDDEVRFLHLLQAADSKTVEMVPSKLVSTSSCDGVEFEARDGNKVIVQFNRNGTPGGKIHISDAQEKKLVEKEFFIH